jgi:type II secretory pathway component GspD/PulD (secretin)
MLHTACRLVVVVGLFSGSGFAWAADADAPRPGFVTLEVVIAEAAANDWATAEASRPAARIRELEKHQKLAAITRVRLSTLEGSIAVAQFGEKAPYVAGRVARGSPRGRDEAGAIDWNWQETGTMLSATPRIEEDGAILVELQLEQSSPRRDAARSGAEAGDNPAPGRFLSWHARSTVRVSNGQPVIVQRVGSGSADGALQKVVLLTAHAEQTTRTGESRSASTRSDYEIKIFALKNASAASAAEIVGNIFEGRPVKVAIDERTNSLILQGRRREFETIEAILLRLDDVPPNPSRK